MKKIDLSKEKIKFVALGDSFAEGFNSFYGFGYAGFMDEATKEIKGASWPSYFARNLQKINKSILESYYNFGLSGTRAKDWNYFLSIDEKKYNYKNSIKKINFATKLNREKLNPNPKRLKFLFKDFGKNDPKDFDFLISKIKDANLITINIGANDILPKFPFDKIIEYVLIDHLDDEKLIKEIKIIINSIIDDVSTLINKIKELNNNSLIYLIDYVQIQSPFWQFQNEVIKNLDIKHKFIDFLMNELNATLKLIAEKTQIFFISINNVEFWKENNYLLSRAFYDIHPTVFGYKKIAQDVFAKTCLSDSFFKNHKNIKSRILSFNDTYYLNDKNCFKNGIDFSKIKISNSQLISKIFGINDELLFKNTSIEQSFTFLEKDLKIENSFSEDNDPENNFLDSLKRSIYFIIQISDILQTNKKLYDDINNLLEKRELKKFIFDNKILSKLANNIQKHIDDYFAKNHHNISYEQFSDLIVNEILDEKNVIWFIRNFSIFLNKTKIDHHTNEIIQITSLLVLSKKTNNLLMLLLEKIIINFLLIRLDQNSKIDKSIIQTIIKFCLDNIDIQKLSTIIIDFYTKNLSVFAKVKNKSDLYNIFFKNKDIISFIKEFVYSVLKAIDINENLAKYVYDKLKIDANKNNINIFISALNSIKTFLLKKGFWIDNIVEFIKYVFLNSNEKINLTMLFNCMFSLSKKDFWKKISELNVNKINKNKLDNILKFIDILLSNIKYDNKFFQILLNIDNPKHYLIKNKFKFISLLKFSEKLKYIKRPLKQLFEIFLSNYYVSNDKNQENNIYYKSYFRLLTILLFISRQLFQKNVNKNIFLNKKLSISGAFLSIAGFKFGSNKGKDNLILNMLNENKNYSLILNNNNSLLYLIYSFDKNNRNKNNKLKKIFESIIDGRF